VAVPTATTAEVTATTTDDITSAEELLRSPGYNPEWGTPKYGGTLKVGQAWAQSWYNPNHSSTYDSLATLFQYDKLVRLDSWEGDAGGIKTDLAKSWKISDDGLTITFELREGVKFRSTGTMVKGGPYGGDFTCEDVQASMDFYLHPDTWTEGYRVASFKNQPLQHINAVNCPDGADGFTVEFKLDFVKGGTMNLLTGSMIVMHDKEYLEWREEVHPLEVNTNLFLLNGTGAWVPDSFDPDIGAKILKNENYWREGLPFLDVWDMIVVLDFATRFTSWASGQLHYFGQGSSSMQPGQVAQAQRDFPELKVHRVMATGGMGIQYNLKKPPFENLNFRKALNLALDHQAFKDLKKSGTFEGTEIYALQAPTTYFAHTTEEIMTWPGYRLPKDADIAEAKSLMAGEFGADSSAWPEISCVSRTSTNYMNLCLFVGDQWGKNLGLKVNMQFLEPAATSTITRGCQHDVTSGWPHLPVPVVDPDNIFLQFYHSESNGWAACSGEGNAAQGDFIGQAALNKLIAKQERIGDPAERKLVVQQIDRELTVEANYSASLEWIIYFYGTRPEVKGDVFTSLGAYSNHVNVWSRMWLDE
jgi:ABC-type transport system substrate-binding protein